MTALKRNLRNQINGFTLIELMIVLSVVSIIVTAAYPSIKSLKDDSFIYSQARMVIGNYRYMQQLAINEQRAYKMVFSPDGVSYSIKYGTAPDEITLKTVSFEGAVSFDQSDSTGISDGILYMDDEGLPIGSAAGTSIKIALNHVQGKRIYIYFGPERRVEILWE